MFVPAVATVNDTVAVTPVAAITLLESTTDGDVSAALKIAGNTTPLCISDPALLTSYVVTMMPGDAAAAAELRKPEI